jgi:hypothetical protein
VGEAVEIRDPEEVEGYSSQYRVDLEGCAPAHRLPRRHILERPTAREPPERAR